MAFTLPADDSPFDNAATNTFTPPSTSTPPASTPSTLVVGTQQAAQDGSYQTLITALGGRAQVEAQMVDRIVDGATTFAPASYTKIALVLPPALITASLVGLLEAALAPGGSLEVHGSAATASEQVASELRVVGLAGTKHDDNTLVSVKSKASSAPLSLKRPASAIDPVASSSSSAAVPLSSALPLRTSRTAKASLWAFTTASASASGTVTPTIDESTLLTEADLERPTLVKRADCDVKRTRKACKNCSCGLKELLLDEQEQDDLAEAGFGAGSAGAAGSTTADGANGVRKIKSVVTSSCGNCYLGDAFRCGSCPYLGMPAFEPGQKVSITAGMDDL